MMEITTIKHKRITEKHIELTFCINGLPYSLSIEEEEDFFVPWALFHEFNEMCPICRRAGKTMNCRYGDIKKLFYYLIKQPSIRLEWLYLPHEEEVEA